MPPEIVHDLSIMVQTSDDELNCEKETKYKTKRNSLIRIAPTKCYIGTEQKWKNRHFESVFFKIVSDGNIPYGNIFLLLCDVVEFLEKKDVRLMRFNKDCLKFFWVGKKCLLDAV